MHKLCTMHAQRELFWVSVNVHGLRSNPFDGVALHALKRV